MGLFSFVKKAFKDVGGLFKNPANFLKNIKNLNPMNLLSKIGGKTIGKVFGKVLGGLTKVPLLGNILKPVLKIADKVLKSPLGKLLPYAAIVCPALLGGSWLASTLQTGLADNMGDITGTALSESSKGKAFDSGNLFKDISKYDQLANNNIFSQQYSSNPGSSSIWNANNNSVANVMGNLPMYKPGNPFGNMTSLSV